MRDFDFGFSIEGDDFIPPSGQAKIDQSADTIQSLNDKLLAEEQKLKNVMSAILPLLNNLMKDPEKPTIYWPERAKKTTEFKAMLLSLAEMEEPEK